MPDWVETLTLDLLQSVPAADLPPGTHVEITRADLDAARAIPQHYRKWTGSAVAEMTQAEKDVVDAAALQASRDAEKARMDSESLLKAMAVYFAQELNKINAGTFTPLTAQGVRDGIKALVDTV